MNILVTGAYGFIGRHCASSLEAEGHVVFRGGRRAHGRESHRHVDIDFGSDFEPTTWLPRLDGVDLVINAVGAMAAPKGASLEDLHARAPIALFDACAAREVAVIHFSALGADEGAASEFHRTKKKADDHLLSILPRSVVLQPSLVYGPGGASAALFDLMASLPLIPLPGDGSQQVQPVHINDVVAVVMLVASVPAAKGRIPLVGPAPVTLRQLLLKLREGLGLGRARFVEVPIALASTGIRLAALFGARWADTETLGMLERGNTGDPTAIRALLGRAPLAVTGFIPSSAAPGKRLRMELAWLSIVLRVSIAAVWLGAAVVSVGLYPLEQSVALVEKTGIDGSAALGLVYAGALVDAVFGIATLLMRKRRRLWAAQIAVILAYTAILTVWLPEQWLHPFGAVLKNLPMLAAIWLLRELEEVRWTT